MALLVSGESLKHATSEVDKLSVLANHSALLNVASEISKLLASARLSLLVSERGKRPAFDTFSEDEGNHLIFAAH